MIAKLLERIRRYRERRNPALFVRRLHAEGIIDDEMLAHACGSWITREQAEAEHRTQQEEHDRTGVHVWLDLTTLSDDAHRYVCQFCDAKGSLPFAYRAGK